IIRHVGEMETDAIARPDAEFGKPRRDTTAERGHLAIAEAAPEKVDQRSVGRGRRHLLQHVGEREGREFNEAVHRKAECFVGTVTRNHHAASITERYERRKQLRRKKEPAAKEI